MGKLFRIMKISLSEQLESNQFIGLLNTFVYCGGPQYVRGIIYIKSGDKFFNMICDIKRNV